MNYYKILKKCTLVILFFITIGCSNREIIPEESYVIKNISIIDPIDGLQSNKHVVVTDDIITMILDNDYEFIANNDNIIDATGKYLIPGLWDAHIHFSYDTSLAPYMPGLFSSWNNKC
jgi:imidazolonepropionase-like amidohydrolase